MSNLNSGRNTEGGGGRGIASPRTINEKKLCYKVPEVAKLLGVSRNHAYELARTGQIQTVRLGKLIFVPKVPFNKMFGVSQESEAEK